MTTKLSLSQIDDSYLADTDEVDVEIDETCYRTTYQRKEIRTKRKREEGELVGSGDIRKHRKY